MEYSDSLQSDVSSAVLGHTTVRELPPPVGNVSSSSSYVTQVSKVGLEITGVVVVFLRDVWLTYGGLQNSKPNPPQKNPPFPA